MSTGQLFLAFGYLVLVGLPCGLLFFALLYQLKEMTIGKRLLAASIATAGIVVFLILSFSKAMIFEIVVVAVIVLSMFMFSPLMIRGRTSFSMRIPFQLLSKPETRKILESTVSEQSQLSSFQGHLWILIIVVTILNLPLGLLSGRIAITAVIQGIFIPVCIMAFPVGWFVGNMLGRLWDFVAKPLWQRVFSVKESIVLVLILFSTFYIGWLISEFSWANALVMLEYLIIGFVAGSAICGSFVWLHAMNNRSKRIDNSQHSQKT